MFCIPSKFRFDALYDSSKMKVKSHIMFQEPKDSFAVLFNLSCRLTSSPSLPSERPFIFLWRCCNPSLNLAGYIVSQCCLNEWILLMKYCICSKLIREKLKSCLRNTTTKVYPWDLQSWNFCQIVFCFAVILPKIELLLLLKKNLGHY